MIGPRVRRGLLVAALLLAAGDAFADSPPMRLELNLLGEPVIYRYGEKQSYFFMTGTGLPKVFEGVPESVHLAERYQIFATTGNAATIVGTAALVGGVWYRLDHKYHRTEKPASWYVVIGGGALSTGGTLLAQASVRLIYQAVNLFNERVQPEKLPEFKMYQTDTGRPEYQVTWSFRP